MNLADLEGLFLDLLRAPEGVEAGLEEMSRRGVAARPLFDAHFLGDERMPAIWRVDVYANMYFFRLRDVLAEDFPRTLAVLGEDLFHNLVTGFLLAHPPSKPSLRWLGQPLPGYLETSSFIEEFPFLADLARLEWACLDAFQSEDAPLLDPSSLSSLRPEDWPAVRFAFAPSVQVVTLRYDVESLFETSPDAGSPPVRLHSLLVYRDDEEDAVWFELDSVAEAFFASLLTGKTFGEACEALSERAGAEDAEALAASLLGEALTRRLISTVK